MKMDVEKKLRDLEIEGRGLLTKKADTQKLLNSYDLRLLEIQGAIKSIRELKIESTEEEKLKSDEKLVKEVVKEVK